MDKKDNPQIEKAMKSSIQAIENGDILGGKKGLIWVLRNDPNNSEAWMLLAGVIGDKNKEADCYSMVLKLDPNNENAYRELKNLGYQPEILNNRGLTRETPKTKGDGVSEHEQIRVEEEVGDPVKYKLEASRSELLDLSLFNKLLNYRSLKTRGVEIIDENTIDLYRILVKEGRMMTFLPTPERNDEDQEILLEEDSSGGDGSLGQPDEFEAEKALRFTDNKLQTPYTSQTLQKRLLNTYYAAQTYIEEQGVNILYLALGMLHWHESQSSELLRRAPLILVPVQLSRSDVRSKFRIRYSDEDIGENLSLRTKLQSDFAIKLPGFPEEEDIDINTYFQDISNVIPINQRWKVDSSAVTLGFFSFGKFLMFNDIDSINWSEESKPEIHPIISGLLHYGFDEERLEFDEEMEIDSVVTPENSRQVVDADSSQTIAILEVNRGRNIVIQGPPGTGKSQTITNLVSEAIGHGKTVLFVSEKMAALEVVKRRLDNVGLGDVCLELHSQKTKKKIVLEELKRSLDLGEPKRNLPLDINELVRNQEKLNNYSKAVNSEIGKSKLTPYEVYGQLTLIKDKLSEIDYQILALLEADRWSNVVAQRNIALTEELQLLINKIGRPVDHPFWGSKKSILLPADRDNICEKLLIAKRSLNGLIKKSIDVSDILQLPGNTTQPWIVSLIENSDFILSSPNFDGIKVKSSIWTENTIELDEFLCTGQRIKFLHNKYRYILKDEAWDKDVLDLRDLTDYYSTKWWRALSRKYRDSKRNIKDLCSQDIPKSLKDQIEIIDAIIEVQKLQPTLNDFRIEAKETFGDKWIGVNSDWDDLIKISSWLVKYHKKLISGGVPKQTINYVASSPDLSILHRETELLKNRLSQHENACQTVVDILELDQSLRFGKGKIITDLSFEEQEYQFNNWENELDRLQEIITLRSLNQKLEENGLGSAVEISKSWKVAHLHLVDLLKLTWLSMTLSRAWVERPILANFDGDIHEHSIVKFCELDTKLLTQNRIKLAYEHWETLPKYRAMGQLGVLYHEFNKKRRHKPIRKLIREAGNLIQVIKPVFMMSPLSIAKFLPPDTIDFDMIIFDEASQVKPVDAFGAILRGKQLVVVGDDRQLPPTTFFETAIDVDDDISDSITVDLESILGLCVAQGINQRMLRWHYRSQHESLITVSNYYFYDNKLVVFPSPDKDKRGVGLRYHYLPNTFYSRGQTRKNLEEAKEVVEAIMHHAKSSPNLTLGVAAFSISQMEAIRDQLEIRRRLDPSCEVFFHSHPEEPFFIKNLENVQGDERDVILISVGYGHTSEGRVSMNFGPINQEGGERRLNVLITRARKRCEVFTNLKADDIDLNRTKSKGVLVLKRFLKYAETGSLDIPIPTGGESDSSFEEAVASRLRELDYCIEHQVGTGGFYIDLAIIDEESPGRYLLGIECDGATYNSAKSARDRDRLRQEVLERLGWRIHRIWSTDWFRNPQREVERLINSIEEAKDYYQTLESNNNFARNNPIQQDPPVQRYKNNARSSPPIDITPYKTANLSIINYREVLHEVSQDVMAEWIRIIVNFESPVHEEEVVRRIANCAGVKRIGRRIRENFHSGLLKATRDGNVIRKEKFLWQPNMELLKIRSRLPLPNSSRKIQLIPPEEIALAIIEIIKASYGINRDMIPPEVCELFGFKRTTNDMIAYVDNLINKLLNEGKIIKNGKFLNLPRN